MKPWFRGNGERKIASIDSNAYRNVAIVQVWKRQIALFHLLSHRDTLLSADSLLQYSN